MKIIKLKYYTRNANKLSYEILKYFKNCEYLLKINKIVVSYFEKNVKTN